MAHRGRRQRGCHDRRAHDVLHLLARALGGRAAAAVAPTIAEGRAERLARLLRGDRFLRTC